MSLLSLGPIRKNENCCARANAIVRAVYGFSAQQQAVVWRRAKHLQVYMA